MKRLLLMGGRPWVTGDKGETFSSALFRYFPSEVKLAFCIFAQPESDWAQTEKWNKEMFDSFKGTRKLSYKTMDADNFEAVSLWADIIYIPGGDPFLLHDRLQPYDLSKLWDDKVIAGSSAGADIFCKAYTYLQDKTFGSGLGWVHATCIPHWRDDFNDYTKEDWDWAEQESLKRYPDLPVLCIPEAQFVEISVT